MFARIALAEAEPDKRRSPATSVPWAEPTDLSKALEKLDRLSRPTLDDALGFQIQLDSLQPPSGLRTG
ncbi:hypothetical protein C3Y91_20920 [Rhizobium sp. UPM1133]|nr:hypothetical protein [Rhizobium ruizarguesonis]